MSKERGWIEFEDGTRWYAKPWQRPCLCIEGVQQCAYHASTPEDIGRAEAFAKAASRLAAWPAAGEER